MLSDQQQQTLEFFDRFAKEWGERALGRESEVNIIKQRNDFVLKVAAARPSTRNALDVGCGTGDLCCDLAARGIRTLGVDFAADMVRMSRQRAEGLGVKNVEFIDASIFDYDWAAGPFDLISANGFIEYISFEQLERFLELAHHNLAGGGTLVLGSRNRLFNLFSLNEFTEAELRDGTFADLAREAIELVRGRPVRDLARLATVSWPEQNRVYAKTGVDVASRHQYTPAQLVRLLDEHGYTPARVGAAHVHPAIPAFKDTHRDVHVGVSEFLQQFAWDDVRLVPNASTFMIEAQKR